MNEYEISLMFEEVEEQILKNLKKTMEKYIANKDTGNTEEKPYECDPKYSWKMCFLAKSRNSENSDSSGKALLLKFFGPMAVWSEPCWCRPKHGWITDGR